MAGSFDNIIRDVLNSTQTHKAGDVIPFPNPEPMLQLEQLPYYGPIENYHHDPYDENWLPMAPANDANLGKQILRS